MIEIDLKDIKIGDFVESINMASGNGSDYMVYKITKKYNQNTGKPYRIFHVTSSIFYRDGEKYSDNGKNLDGAIFYIAPTDQIKAIEKFIEKINKEYSDLNKKIKYLELNKKALSKLNERERNSLGLDFNNKKESDVNKKLKELDILKEYYTKKLLKYKELDKKNIDKDNIDKDKRVIIKKPTKSELLVMEKKIDDVIKNNEYIHINELTEILGREPNIPEEKIGRISLMKMFMRPYYRKV